MNTNDSELIEFAAKAAGYSGWTQHWWSMCDGENYWNPLLHNGQALKLRNHLHMTVMSNETMSWVATGMNQVVMAEEPHDGSNVDAATRRAIVRAAAEIGKNMP